MPLTIPDSAPAASSWYFVPMRWFVGMSAVALAFVACKEGPTEMDKILEASAVSSAPPPPPDAPPSAPPPPVDAGPSDAAAAWDGSMPPRPIPKPAMTVSAMQPPEVQLRTITYMAAMQQPRFDDAPPDKDYTDGLAAQLRPILMALDKGTPEDKQRLNRVEVLAGGRRIDLLLADGCDAQMPARTVQRASAPFVTLLAHGVLVIRCNDARAQCLQSTRDPSDILCTTAPRHH
jgi:hypothetical protein